ncbi:MAG: hypothetical protein MJ194_00155 [Clostridia bacterium]|nr:hypothetical protein [Clostridia bacterium]
MTRKTMALCYSVAGICFGISGAAGFVAGRSGYAIVRIALGAALIFLAVVNFRAEKGEGAQNGEEAPQDEKRE